MSQKKARSSCSKRKKQGKIGQCRHCGTEVHNVNYHHYVVHQHQWEATFPDGETTIVHRSTQDGKFHCPRCEYVTPHAPSIAQHAKRACKGIIQQQPRPTNLAQVVQAQSSYAESVGPLAMKSPAQIIGELVITRAIQKNKVSKDVIVISDSSDDEGVERIDVRDDHEVENMLDGGRNQGYCSPLPPEILNMLPSTPEFVQGSSRDRMGTFYPQPLSRESSGLSYADPIAPADIDITTSSIFQHPRDVDNVPSLAVLPWQEQLPASFSEPSTTPPLQTIATPVSKKKARFAKIQEQLQKSNPTLPDIKVYSFIKSVNPPLRSRVLDGFARIGVQTGEDLELVYKHPERWEQLRISLMKHGIMVTEWFLIRRAMLNRSGVTARHPYPDDKTLSEFFDRIAVPGEIDFDAFYSIGIYLLEDIALLSTHPSEWMLAGMYLLTFGLEFRQWLVVKRGLSRLRDPCVRLDVSKDIVSFLFNLKIPLSSKSRIFSNIGFHSLDDLNLWALCDERSWERTLRVLELDGLTNAESESLKDALRLRRQLLVA
ncbi:hypothetical protein C8Q75DRAFT_784900 [Abortiporus biennis]|nr:hypothetical protein C8Q75DRAFT_784900 [Abortiporus biennis]